MLWSLQPTQALSREQEEFSWAPNRVTGATPMLAKPYTIRGCTRAMHRVRKVIFIPYEPHVPQGWRHQPVGQAICYSLFSLCRWRGWTVQSDCFFPPSIPFRGIGPFSRTFFSPPRVYWKRSGPSHALLGQRKEALSAQPASSFHTLHRDWVGHVPGSEGQVNWVQFCCHYESRFCLQQSKKFYVHFSPDEKGCKNNTSLIPTLNYNNCSYLISSNGMHLSFLSTRIHSQRQLVWITF